MMCRHRANLAAIVTTTLVLVPALAHAGNPAVGRQKAKQCQACHGLDGVSRLAEAPNLSGQIEQYLVKALHDYKSGARQNEMMTLMAAGLADDDIADLAAHYAAIEIVVNKK